MVSVNGPSQPSPETRARDFKMTDDTVVDFKSGRPKKPLTEKQLERNRKARAPASGIPARGPGWGGAAKGAGNHAAGPGQPPDGPERQAKIADKQALAAEAMETLALIMRTSALDMAKLSAAQAILDRTAGKAVQRTITASADDLERLSDDELRAELARFGPASA